VPPWSTYPPCERFADIAWCGTNHLLTQNPQAPESEGNSGGESHAVGSKDANSLGLHDMLGNVADWVSDISSLDSTEAQSNPKDRRLARSV